MNNSQPSIWKGMTKKPKPGPNRSRTQRKPTLSNGFRSPVRISIDHEALAALDKRAIAAQVGVGVVAGWQAGLWVDQVFPSM
jgi:hypothetical protein